MGVLNRLPKKTQFVGGIAPLSDFNLNIHQQESSNNIDQSVIMKHAITQIRANEESFGGFFTINRRNKKGISVYGTHECNDEALFDFLLYIALERVLCFSLPNSCLSDAGATILFEYLQDQFSLNTLKLYNNVMKLVGNWYLVAVLCLGGQTAFVGA